MDLRYPETAPKSGRISMQKAANNRHFFISYSSLGKYADPFGEISTREFYQQFGLGIITKKALCDFAENLTALADKAYFRRDLVALGQISQALINLPLPDQYHHRGIYYRGLLIKRQGRFDEARRLQEGLSETAPPEYRARAMLAAGAIAFDSGDLQSALSLSFEANRFFHHRDCRNHLIAIDSSRMIAVVKSVEGEHQTALRILENLAPLARFVGHKHPVVWHALHNSLAVELTELGRFEEARRHCNIALASPFVSAYPEWQETARTLAEKTRPATRLLLTIGSPEPEGAAWSFSPASVFPSINPSPRVIPLRAGGNIQRRHSTERKSSLQAPASVLPFRDKSVRLAKDVAFDDPACLEKRYEIMVAAAESPSLQLIDALYETLMKMKRPENIS